MKTSRTIQFLYVRDMLKGALKDIPSISFFEATEATELPKVDYSEVLTRVIENNLVMPGVSAIRYAAMVVHVARGGI